MVLLLGVDRFISEARAITNTIDNGVATLAIARWVEALDMVKLKAALDGKSIASEESKVGDPTLEPHAQACALSALSALEPDLDDFPPNHGPTSPRTRRMKDASATSLPR